jgi:urease accessory protein
MLAVPSVLAFSTAPASAHIMMEGAGEITNGALHPLMTPAHVLVLLAAGLLCGQNARDKDANPLRVFAPVLAVALLATLAPFLSGELWEPVVIGMSVVLAALVALGIRLPRVAVMVLTILPAVVLGLDSGAEAETVAAKVKTLAGTWVTASALVFYVSACASNAEGKPWARTAIRVLGSWIVAIGLMVLAFALKK